MTPLSDLISPLFQTRRLMVNRTCETCRYGDFGYSGHEGLCRRSAPIIVLASPNTDPHPMTLWPTVKVSDWCGEHQLKNSVGS